MKSLSAEKGFKLLTIWVRNSLSFVLE